jgi:tRNA A-37 threonylcarbamoyl transferase component Bud32
MSGARAADSVSPDANDAHFARIQRALPDGLRLLRIIGRGGFATVYEARDERIDRAVAIKVLHEDLGSASHRDRFRREAQLLARLRHPGIVPVYDVGEADGITWYSMPLVRGESLRARLERGPLSIDEGRRLLQEIAGALQAAHVAGILHRDIKPDNILIDGETGDSLLTDFGIAKSITDGSTSLTATGMLVGTPQYMSPEQLAGDAPVTTRSDLFALGVVAYQAITGEKAFDAPALPLLIAKVIGEEPVPITWHRPDCPPHVARAVMRCLEKDAEARWESAAAFGNALAGLDSEGPASEPTSPRESVVRRRQMAAALDSRMASFRLALLAYSGLFLLSLFLEASPYAAGISLIVLATAAGHLLSLTGSAWVSGIDGNVFLRMAVGLRVPEIDAPTPSVTPEMGAKAARVLVAMRTERRVLNAILLRLPQAELSRMPRVADLISTTVAEAEHAGVEIAAIDDRLATMRTGANSQFQAGVSQREDASAASELRERRRRLLEALEESADALRGLRLRIQSRGAFELGDSLDTLASASGRLRKRPNESPTGGPAG